jgi:uncharacterized protein (TIGR02594 family)
LAREPSTRGLNLSGRAFIVNYEGTVLMLFGHRKVLAICSIAFSLAATSAFADLASTENPKSERAFTKVSAKAAASRRAARSVKTRPATAAAHASAPAASSSLVNEARRYLGSGPVFGRKTLWCGNFMDYVLRKTGHKPGGNLASSYASYGRRVAGPQVGALAIMTRGKRGGHVGVVSGVTPEGNVVVVSGNHNNAVAESVYPRSRIYAYVMPGA